MNGTRPRWHGGAGRSLLLCAVSGVALSLAAGLEASAQEAASQEVTAGDQDFVPEDGDTVVVTGIRQSLQDAQTIRRDADTVVDAVTAEDIGALPDRSVAEALQRVPGLNITRFAKTTDPDRFSVEGSGVIIRGLPFVRSELNGRDVFSATGGRALSFNDVSPELLSSILVFKNTTADMIDGGIAGTVNLITRNPLDTPGPQLAGTIEGNYGDLREEWSPSYSLLASNTFETDIGTFGIQAGYANSELLSRSDATQITDPCYRDPAQIGIYTDAYSAAQQCLRVNGVTSGGVSPGQNFSAANFPPAGSIIVPQGAGARTTTYDRDREALSLVGQWESPDRSMLVTGTYLRAEATQLLSEYAILGLVNGNIPSQPAFGQSWTYDGNGDFLAGQLTNTAWRGESNCAGTFANAWSINPAGAADLPCQPTSGLGAEMLRFEQERTAVTEDFALNIKIDPTDRLSFNFDVQHIKSDLTEDSIITVNNTYQDVFIDLRTDVPIVRFVTPSTADGSSNGPLGNGFATNRDYTYYGFALDSRIRNAGDLTSVRADTEYEFESEGFLDSVRFGARWAERNRVTRDTNFSNWGALSAPWGGCCEQFGAAAPFNAVYASDIPAFVTPTSPFQGFQRGETPAPYAAGLYWAGAPGSLINAYQSGAFQAAAGSVVNQWEADTFAAGGYVIPGWRDVSSRQGVLPDSYFRQGEISDVSEETMALYGRVDFSADDLLIPGSSLSGNVGVRYVETIVRSDGSISFPTLGQFPFLADLSTSCNVPPGGVVPPVCQLSPARLAEFLSIATGETIADDADIKFESWLPSLNATFEWTDGLLLRLGVSKGIFRPDLASYRTGGAIGDNLNALEQEGTLQTGTLYGIRTGNRLLEATESWNYDLSAEWYWDDVGSLIFSVFYKEIEGIETGGVSLRDFANSFGDDFEVLVSGPSNDGAGALKGFEASYIQVYDMLPSFWGNFGVQASYTYVDGGNFTNTTDVNVVRQAIAASQPFAGISEHTVNLAAFYEDERLSGRLAYNWRSEYLSTPRDDIFPFSPIFVEDTGQLDGSLFYTVSENLKIGVQGVNLLDEITETSQVLGFDGTRMPRSYFRNDRRYTVSARFNF
jgi:TonB-dependent receptor